MIYKNISYENNGDLTKENIYHVLEWRCKKLYFIIMRLIYNIMKVYKQRIETELPFA